jgi:membrane associated rhomboid family serine protease
MNRRSNALDDFLTRWLRSGYPLTLALIAANFLTLLLVAFRVPVYEYLALQIPQTLVRPWTIVTYPLVSFGVFGMIFHGIWLYFVGGSLERSWGTRTFALYYLAMTVISALGLILGAFVLRVSVMADSWLPIAALTVAFCLLNPHEVIRFWFILPIPARMLAVIEVVIIFFVYALGYHPLMGIFALTGCLASYLWVRNRSWSDIGYYTPTAGSGIHLPQLPRRPPPPPDDRSRVRRLNPFECWARKRRKKQFERLMRDD